MAAFQFRERSIELDFCGKLKYKLPLDDVTAKKLEKAGEYLKENRPTEEGQDIFENLCDLVMDAIDMILGEGAADQIAALKESFNFWDATDVFQHITTEFNTAFEREKNQFMEERPQKSPAPSNRAQRRAEAKAKVAAIRSKA